MRMSVRSDGAEVPGAAVAMTWLCALQFCFVLQPLYEELEAVEEVLDQGPDRPIKAICLHNLANNIAQWKAKEEQRRLAAGDYSNVAEKEAGELPK